MGVEGNTRWQAVHIPEDCRSHRERESELNPRSCKTYYHLILRIYALRHLHNVLFRQCPALAQRVQSAGAWNEARNFASATVLQIFRFAGAPRYFLLRLSWAVAESLVWLRHSPLPQA
jgi:hypothetical protein